MAVHVSGLRGVRQQSSAGLCLDQRTPVSRRLALMWFLMIMWKWTIQLHWLHERETITWCDYKYGAASTRRVKSWCAHISNVLAKLSRRKHSYNFVNQSDTNQSPINHHCWPIVHPSITIHTWSIIIDHWLLVIIGKTSLYNICSIIIISHNFWTIFFINCHLEHKLFTLALTTVGSQGKLE